MNSTSNHSSSRIYLLSRPGQRLAAYLDYVESRPTLSPDIAFADVAAATEQYDLDRSETELERLYREMAEALEDMRGAGPNDDDAFVAARDRYKALVDRVYHLENDLRPLDDENPAIDPASDVDDPEV